MEDRHHDPVVLWPDGAPGALGNEPHDTPTLTPYPAKERTGLRAAVVICPGGGYGKLAPHEGRDYALWLKTLGITGFVLKYRLGSDGYRHPCMLLDARRALRWVRAHARLWDVDPDRIGVMGSSAGGHLASMLLTQHSAGRPLDPDPVERVSSRPDLGVLCYPVITMAGDVTHAGSKRNLLGEDPSPALAESVSSEAQVRADTPPCFIWHTWEDASVKVENSLDFARALRRHGVPFDLHVYQAGRHGLGLADSPPFHAPHPWAADLAYWLRLQRFV